MMVSDEKRTNEFLGAASRGDTARVRAMLQQQFNPNAADYDGGRRGRARRLLATCWSVAHSCCIPASPCCQIVLAYAERKRLPRPHIAGRTALHLACAKGAADVVELLLLAGASPGKRDALGSTALLEAAKAGQDRCLELLIKQKATLELSTTETAARLCECASNSDLPQLRWVAAGLARLDAKDTGFPCRLCLTSHLGSLQAGLLAAACCWRART
jgi:hypothetical protein